MIFPDISPFVPFLGPYEFNIGSWHVGPIGLRWYALAYVAGILVGWRYAVGLVRDARLWGGKPATATPAQIDDLILWVTLGIIAGGRIGSVLFYPTEHDGGLLSAFKIWEGGMSFHGGLIGVIIALIVFARVNRIDMLKLGDLAAPAVPFGLFFGRIANFINGELWGRETDVPWGMVFCNDTIVETYGRCVAGMAPRHPSQLYEAALEGLVLFLILRFATHRMGWLQRQGGIVGLFLFFYAAFRISLENVRNPDIGMPEFPLGLTMGMMLSIPMLIAGAWLIWRAMRQPAPVPPRAFATADAADA